MQMMEDLPPKTQSTFDFEVPHKQKNSRDKQDK